MKKRKNGIVFVIVILLTLNAFSVLVRNYSNSKLHTQQSDNVETRNATTPKYIFLFIGDGMSYPQIQLTNYYKNVMNQNSSNQEYLKNQNLLAMMNFEVIGNAQTYDSISLIPASSSAGTAIASGHKTKSASINVSEDGTRSYKTIAESLKEEKGYKIGIITSVNLNHATPASFYAHQVSRMNYYEIGLELIASDFDYFAGGGLRSVTGMSGEQESLYTIARKNGYQITFTRQEAKQVKKGVRKAMIVAEDLADQGTMSYEIDRKTEDWRLADYVKHGIQFLDNDTGFFLMVEGGKIDWACHANDAATTIAETMAFDESIQVAIDFYEEDPTETLILVTGDHECGGLTVGSVETNYDTYLSNLSNQRISFAKFDSEYITSYKKNQTEFPSVCHDIENLFGLKVPEEMHDTKRELDEIDQHKHETNSGSLVMTAYEYDRLKEAYNQTLNRDKKAIVSEEEYNAYGSYEPLTVTITHILNHKCGVSFSTYAHSALPVPVFAHGLGAKAFQGYYDNTDIYKKLANITGILP